MMLLFTSNQDLFPPYWLDHCQDNFIEMLRQNYDDKDSRSMIVSQPTLLSNDADDLFSDPLLVDQLAEDASGNSIEDELGHYLNDGQCRRDNNILRESPTERSFDGQSMLSLLS